MAHGLLFISLLLCLILTVAVEAEVDVWKYFNAPFRSFPDTDERCGCKSHKAEIESAYKEAAKVSCLLLNPSPTICMIKLTLRER